MFKNSTISARLSMGFAVMMMLLIASALVGLYSLSNIAEDTNDLAKDKLYKVNLVTQIMRRVQANAESVLLLGVLDATIPAEKARIDKEAAAIQERFITNSSGLKDLESLITTVEGKEKLSLVIAVRTRYSESLNRIVKAARETDSFTPALKKQYLEDYLPLKDSLVSTYQDFANYQIQLANITGEQAQTSYRISRNLTLTISCIACVIAFVLAWSIRKAIVEPLRQCIEAAKRIAQGQFDSAISSDAHNETGELLRAIAEMQESVQNIIRDVAALTNAAKHGNLSTRAESTQYRGEYKKLLLNVNQLLDEIMRPLQEAITVLNDVAENRLDVSMKGTYSGDFATMARTLNTTITTMNGVLSEVAMAAAQVNEGSSYLADSSSLLSSGATEQAASLEEISSSLHEISNQALQSANQASEAEKLAQKSEQAAEHGTDQMSSLVTAMQELNSSSRNISKVIKVIDEIAFQTNLLALNAAVEAARAGRHGKGFAVVAEEVRNLANRSAKAARESTTMIEAALSNIALSESLTNRNAQSLKEIQHISGQVRAFVSEIAIAAKEQSAGIGQINAGMMQISQVVQNTSANAEESASASHKLSNYATNLRDLVQRFRLSTTNALPFEKPSARLRS